MIRNVQIPVATLLGWLLTACNGNAGYVPPEALPPPNLQAHGQQAGIVTVRVVVQFNSDKLAFAEEKFITALQVQAQVPMHYVAAVSADTHVYGLELPTAQSPTQALQRLRALPSVVRSEVDSRAKAQ